MINRTFHHHHSTVKILLRNLEFPVTIFCPGLELEEDVGLTQCLLLVVFQVKLVAVSNESLKVFFVRVETTYLYFGITVSYTM